MIELAIALGALAGLAGILWWYDNQQTTELEQLFSAEEYILELLAKQFAAEERLVDRTCDRAATAVDRADSIRFLAAGAEYIAELVPERLTLLRRLAFYSKIARAFGPTPALRIVALRSGFAALLRGRPEVDWLAESRREFRALNKEMLESWRRLFASSRKG